MYGAGDRCLFLFFFFKQKTAYELRIIDWSSDVCSADLDCTALVEEIAGYGHSDLICYRAEEPPSLAQRQEEAWQPLVAWAAERYDVALNVTTGIVAVEIGRASGRDRVCQSV